MEEIRLPEPRAKGGFSLEECVENRRSIRSYQEREIDLELVSQLCWSAQGITDSATGFRAAPSAGATYPLEIYLVQREGFFRYLPQEHKLVGLNSEDLRIPLAEAAHGQNCVRSAPLDIIITAVYERTTRAYGERGVRYVHIEVGHVAQNIHLQAVSSGLSSVPVGAFHDSEVKKVLGLPEEEEPLYIIPVGYSR
jgi:SagB-type dehydrogenase family enzyme